MLRIYLYESHLLLIRQFVNIFDIEPAGYFVTPYSADVDKRFSSSGPYVFCIHSIFNIMPSWLNALLGILLLKTVHVVLFSGSAEYILSHSVVFIINMAFPSKTN